jgi:hypothetical protein
MTISLEDDLHAKASEAAAGQSVDEFVAATLRRMVNGAIVQMELRDGLPVIVTDPDAPTIDPNVIRRSIEEEGF